ncbi:MAG: 4Fe-4S dicluster domain-containing protein [Dehalococcoidia bacterium]
MPDGNKLLQIFPQRCTGCMQCELACSWVQTGTFQPSRSLIRVNIFDEQAIYSPFTCFQCDEAWCMQVCPVNAIDVDPKTGAKIVLDDVCVGCKLCVIACPFGTVFLNPDTKKAYKCDLCGGDPACVHACPTDAIEFAQFDNEDWIPQWGDKVNEAYLTAVGGS